MLDMLMVYLLLGLFILIFSRLVILSIERNASVILFLVAFFTFLMGRVVMEVLPVNEEINLLLYSLLVFSDETMRHVYLSLYLSLLFIYIGYVTNNDNSLCLKFNPNSERNLFIRRCAKRILMFSSPFALVLILDKVDYVLSHGYSQVFMDYKTSLPIYFIIFEVLFESMVFLFLATLPSKKDAFPVIAIYISIFMINIFSGDRGESILPIFLIIYYLYFRNVISPNEKWINKKGLVYLVISFPVVVIILFLVAYIRSNNEFSSSNIATLFFGFFYQQSVSVNVIACTYQDYDMLPQSKLYSLGAIIDYFRNNYLTRIILGEEPYPVGSIELALEGHSLDAALTYVENTSTYFSGGGMGSSFVAESWYDFGYLGVIIFSYFYGYVLSYIPKMNAKNVWMSVIALMLFRSIVYAPRARATGFVSDVFSVSFWPIAFIIYLLSLKYTNRN